jgi:hypothetical protein
MLITNILPASELNRESYILNGWPILLGIYFDMIKRFSISPTSTTWETTWDTTYAVGILL